MNEEDILFLQENGLKVDDIGAIVDLNGNYVQEFSLDGRTVQSYASKDYFDYNNDYEKQANAAGYEFDENSSYDADDQKEQAIAKVKINEYSNDPNYGTAVSIKKQDSNTQVAFEDLMEERRVAGEPYYDSMEAMEQGIETTKQETIERDAILSQMDNPKDQEEYVKTQTNLKAFEKENGKDALTKLKDYREQDEIAVDGRGNVIQNPGEDASVLEKAKYTTSKFFSDARSTIASAFYSEGEGIEGEGKEEEYLALKDKEHALVAPIAEKNKLEIDTKVEALKEQLKVSSDDDYSMLIRQIQQLEQKSIQLDDFVKRNNIDWSIFTAKKAVDLASFGFLDVWEQYNIDLDISKKLENKEELTEGEQQYLETQITLEELNSNPAFDQKFWHEATGGTIDSVAFLAGGWGGRMAGKGASRYLTTKLSKLSTPLVQTLAVSGNLAAQTALHSGTYNSSIDKYIGDAEVREDKNGQPVFLARQDLYNTLKEENRLKIEELDEAIGWYADRENVSDPIALKELQEARKNLIKYDASIKKPFSAGKSLLYGGFETLKEVASEQLGGAILGKLGSAGKNSAKWI